MEIFVLPILPALRRAKRGGRWKARETRRWTAALWNEALLDSRQNNSNGGGLTSVCCSPPSSFVHVLEYPVVDICETATTTTTAGGGSSQLLATCSSNKERHNNNNNNKKEATSSSSSSSAADVAAIGGAFASSSFATGLGLLPELSLDGTHATPKLIPVLEKALAVADTRRLQKYIYYSTTIKNAEEPCRLPPPSTATAVK